MHTASDIPLSAMGAGAALFTGVMDNTDVFFRAMTAVINGAGTTAPAAVTGQRTASDRLINLSSRGMVGVGNQAMLAGFVVSGSQPRTMLVRGVGPGLSKFGLGGVLADPVIRILSASGQMLYSNDNWEANTNVGAVQGATTMTGAFALDSGSKDAALLVTLPPGNYSVQVAGAGDTTGMALAEIYETP